MKSFNRKEAEHDGYSAKKGRINLLVWDLAVLDTPSSEENKRGVEWMISIFVEDVKEESMTSYDLKLEIRTYSNNVENV